MKMMRWSLLIGALFVRGGSVRPAQRSDCYPEFRPLRAAGAPLQQFREQALTSLRAVHPDVQFLLDRPADTIGSVRFALLAYRDDARASTVRILGKAASLVTDVVWDFELTCNIRNFGDGVVTTMVELANLIAPIGRPLRKADLIGGRFVVYTTQWQIDLPGGDPIQFLAGDAVVNAWAGLGGHWSVMGDTTLSVGGITFHLRAPQGDLVAPSPRDSAGAGIVYWIERAGVVRRRPYP